MTTTNATSTNSTTRAPVIKVALARQGWAPAIEITTGGAVDKMSQLVTAVADNVTAADVVDAVHTARQTATTVREFLQSDTARTFQYIGEQLNKVTRTLQESNYVRQATEAATQLTGNLGKFFTTVSDNLSVMVFMNDLIRIVTQPMTIYSLIDAYVKLYKIIQCVVHTIIPDTVVLYQLLKQHWSQDMERQEQQLDEEQFFDAVDVAQAEAGGSSIINLAYTYFITKTFPEDLRVLLKDFQGFTRVKVLEDVNWLTDIPLTFLSLPDYVLGLVERFAGKFEILKGVVPYVQQTRASYTSVVNTFPELLEGSLQNRLAKILDSIRTDRSQLAQISFVRGCEALKTEIHEFITRMRVNAQVVNKDLMAMFGELNNLLTSATYLIKVS